MYIQMNQVWVLLFSRFFSASGFVGKRDLKFGWGLVGKGIGVDVEEAQRMEDEVVGEGYGGSRGRMKGVELLCRSYKREMERRKCDAIRRWQRRRTEYR